ncbi:MAG TPA: DUF547 domain-containing protein [Chitinophagaceae bacterium]|nr:DUF547 domain-containing protein [Chitinophagaceae bacterium]
MKRSLCFVFFVFLVMMAAAQDGYAKGDIVTDFPLKKILNYSSATSSLNQLKQKLTIVDFFGTWCVPCINALPHLAEVQQKYSNQIQILLVSTEEEEKLKKFIANQKNFSLAIVVDEDEIITALFQPPSYPYTAVLNEEGKILATITDAFLINEAAITSWLTDKSEASISKTFSEIKKTNAPVNIQKSTNPVVQLSQDFLYAAKTGEQTKSFEVQLSSLDFSFLQKQLKNENTKKAFWINLYNAYSNSILKKDPEKYKNRNRFFKAKQIEVAGKMLSLDEIEHDFLRRTKIKWSLGHLNKLFPSKTAKALRVNEVDYRIHFALNCGAKSCPPIAYYTPEKLDQQLDLATKSYLHSESDYDKEKNIILLPRIMSWFRADFGGKKGMKEILKKHGIIPADVNPKIKFKAYDWTLELNNYKTETE